MPKGVSFASKQQHLLYQYVKQVSSVKEVAFHREIFPADSVMMNARVSPMRNKHFELDVFIPALSLALEYNGEYHYKFVPVYR